MNNKRKKDTRKALKDESTSYNARFVLRYHNLFDEEKTNYEDEETGLI